MQVTIYKNQIICDNCADDILADDPDAEIVRDDYPEPVERCDICGEKLED